KVVTASTPRFNPHGIGPRPRSPLSGPDGNPPTWSERLQALKYVPPLLKLVYQTHRGYTVAILTLRALRSFIPLAVLWIGKLIIDGVIAAMQVRAAGGVVDWWSLGGLVGLGLGIAVGGVGFASLSLLLVVAVVPSFLGETHFAALGYSLLFQWTPERRLLDYLRYAGASDEMAKEVKLFNLSDFLVGRYAKLSGEFYDANKRLAIKRNVVSTVFVTIGTLGYYGAYAVPICRGFEFQDVGFRYPGSDRWAVRHLTFTFEPEERIALVGENGAGKTTLVKLLARLYDPDEGRILLDGVDLREYDLGSLRKN